MKVETTRVSLSISNIAPGPSQVFAGCRKSQRG
jgi:hypothetical protein